MNRKAAWLFGWVFVFGCAGFLRADDPTSKFVPLAPLASTLAPSSTGLMVQLEIRDQVVGGALIYAEAHTVDTDAGSNITNDTNFADLLLGRPGGLEAANFPYGSSRYLDVTQGGVSVLAARLPLYASVFSLTDSGFIAGNLTMGNSTPTAGNLLKGGVRFLHNYGTNNTFLGLNAGNFMMTGGNNTASGVSALFSNTTGFWNTASGVDALRSNTTGCCNTASGVGALRSNTTGDRNTASGLLALENNTTGYDNTASGSNALRLNTTGFANTASGAAALSSNTTGDRNAASGVNALRFNTTGRENTASGTQALFNNTTGSANTASGVNALRLNTTGFYNTASGSSALRLNTTGFYNTASGAAALSSNTTGNSNTAIGASADVYPGNLTNATAIGAGAVVNASNKIRLGNTDVTVIEGQVAYTFPSDKTKKENFQPVDGEEVLRKIRTLSLTSWNYIGHDPKEFRHYGPMAQEFFAAFGHDGIGTIGTPTTINSGDMAGILMIAVQALEQRTAALAAENAELRARLEALERQTGR